MFHLVVLNFHYLKFFIHYNEALFPGFRVVLCLLLYSPGGKGGGGWLANGSVMLPNISS